MLMGTFVLAMLQIVVLIVALKILRTAEHQYRVGVIVALVRRLRYVRFQISAFRLGGIVIILAFVELLVALTLLGTARTRIRLGVIVIVMFPVPPLPPSRKLPNFMSRNGY